MHLLSLLMFLTAASNVFAGQSYEIVNRSSSPIKNGDYFVVKYTNEADKLSEIKIAASNINALNLDKDSFYCNSRKSAYYLSEEHEDIATAILTTAAREIYAATTFELDFYIIFSPAPAVSGGLWSFFSKNKRMCYPVYFGGLLLSSKEFSIKEGNIVQKKQFDNYASDINKWLNSDNE